MNRKDMEVLLLEWSYSNEIKSRKLLGMLNVVMLFVLMFERYALDVQYLLLFIFFVLRALLLSIIVLPGW